MVVADVVVPFLRAKVLRVLKVITEALVRLVRLVMTRLVEGCQALGVGIGTLRSWLSAVADSVCYPLSAISLALAPGYKAVKPKTLTYTIACHWPLRTAHTPYPCHIVACVKRVNYRRGVFRLWLAELRSPPRGHPAGQPLRAEPPTRVRSP